ncbi:hypothetical protein EJ05DRAFT_747 [Pseudovirgaria hyperparasitica]|uniref:Uncharacterized protein n=1 Tax=Pseudovirgaria hyperparasitica TaxID=470096 RepID=A0A6A6WJK8_9PEZI|nr:uncharacterized protein EJ05DRAFT_747 [Pseudovirgaria hyperparasitica]KAF2762416.1 hypothetical protein EJ05DRAFT_747 [Pseudovirgaria hyperparasitica]
MARLYACLHDKRLKACRFSRLMILCICLVCLEGSYSNVRLVLAITLTRCVAICHSVTLVWHFLKVCSPWVIRILHNRYCGQPYSSLIMYYIV